MVVSVSDERAGERYGRWREPVVGSGARAGGGEPLWNDLDSLPAARSLAVPALFAVAPGDRYVSVADLRRIYQASSARPKRLVVLSQPLGHGWTMLSDDGWTRLASTVAAWVAGRYR